MTPHKTRKICLMLLAAMVLLIMMGAAWKRGILLFLGYGCIAAVFVLMLMFWRCPRCGKSLGGLENRKYCSHCGKSLGGE